MTNQQWWHWESKLIGNFWNDDVRMKIGNNTKIEFFKINGTEKKNNKNLCYKAIEINYIFTFTEHFMFQKI